VRVHRLTLKNYRGIDEREVDFADSGITVVEGPNEAGKSSMVEALDLLLNEKADSRKARVRAVQPAGRDVGSEVCAEISCGAWRFEYFKRFNRKPETSLTITAPVREQHTGRTAHERVEAMLGDNLDRALFAALQLLQSGDPELGGLADSSALARALDRAAGPAGAESGEGTGADETGADDDASENSELIAAVEDEYRRYFTAGQGRPTGEYAQARKAEKAARAEVEQRETALAAVDEVTRLLPQVQARMTELTRDDEAAAVAVADLDRQVAKGEALEEKVAAARARLGQLDAELEMARSRCAARDEAGRQLAELAAAVGREEAAEAQWRERAEQSAAQASALETELVTAREALTALQSRVDAAETAASVRADRARLDELDRALERLERLEADAAGLQSAVDANPVRPEHVSEAAALTAELARATARLDAAGTSAAVTALGSQPVLVDGEAVAGETVFTVGGEQTVEVPGVVRVVLRGGADARSLSADLEALTTRSADLCAACGVTDPGEIAARAAERDAAVRELAAVRAEQQTILGGAQAAALRAEREALAARLPDQRDPEPGEDLTELRGEERRLAELTRQAESTAVRKRAEAGQAQARAGAAAEALESARAALAARTQALTAERAQLSDEALRGAAELAAGRHADAGQTLTARERDLATCDLPGLRTAYDEAQQHAQRIRDQLAALRDERTGLLTRLEVCRDDGRLDELGEARAAHEAAREALSRIEERATAAQMLREVLLRKRTDSRSRYVAPFTRRLEELAAPVFGDSVRFEVGDDFAIARRTLDGVTVDVDALSGGAREQLGLIARLACAMLVDENDGVPVILDDALGYSDPERLASMATVLGAAADDAQIIVLTCDPQRYAAVPGATMIAV